MNTPELIYKIVQFFFSNFWIYLGLIMLILTIKGDMTKAIKGIKEFIKKVSLRYSDKRKEIEGLKTYRDTIGKKS